MVSAKWDWNEAMRVSKEESYEEGKKDGRFSLLTDLVKKGRLSLANAAEELGLSVDEFKKEAML